MNRTQALALCGMDETAHALLGIYCAEHFSENRLAGWFSETAFEALRPEVSCMAAAVSTAQNYCGAPRELIPRLRGIMKYVHTLNSGMAAGLLSLGRQCNEAGIPVILLGGTAIHFSATNPPQRHMWRMEIGVSEDNFHIAVELAKQTGFAVEQTQYSATARKGNTCCILIRKGMESTLEATPLTLSGVTFLIPCDTEQLVSLVQTGFEMLLTSDASLLPWFMDMHSLVKDKPDWEAVAAASEKRGAVTQVRLMLELYSSLAQSAQTEATLSLFGTGGQSARIARRLLKYRRCKPNTFQRRWLGAQIRSNTGPFGALWHMVTGKLRRIK